MTLLVLSPESLARSRFALSPLAETVSVLITLARGDEPALEPWVSAHRPRFLGLLQNDAFAAGFVALASSTKWLPAPFLHPARRRNAHRLRARTAAGPVVQRC